MTGPRHRAAAMDKPTFLKRADACIERVAAWLEDFDPDEVDFAEADGVLKIQFADGATYVLNRQTAANQMWFAAEVRAWHYDWNDEDGTWRSDKDDHELFECVGDVIGKKLGRPVSVTARD